MLTMRRVLDGIVAVLGLWLIISAFNLFPAQFSLAMWIQVVLGLAVIGFALWGELPPPNAAPEMMNVFLGGLIFISPWLLSFTMEINAAWNVWIVGVAMVVLEALALPNAMLERTPHQPS